MCTWQWDDCPVSRCQTQKSFVRDRISVFNRYCVNEGQTSTQQIFILVCKHSQQFPQLSTIGVFIWMHSTICVQNSNLFSCPWLSPVAVNRRSPLGGDFVFFFPSWVLEMASGALVLLAVCITIATPGNSDQTKNVPRVEEDHLIIKSFLSLAPTPYQSGCNFGPIWQMLSSHQQVFSHYLGNISLSGVLGLFLRLKWGQTSDMPGDIWKSLGPYQNGLWWPW